MPVRKVTVTEDGMFEILCADCLRDEPFPEEIKVTGNALGWAARIKEKAAKRKVRIKIVIDNLED